MAKQQFGDVAKINNNFLHNNKVSDQVANAMYTDPWYGL